MSQDPVTGNIFIALHILIQIALIARVLLRPHRDPASRIAWIVVIMAVPVLGILGYILLGETSIGRRRVARLGEVLSRLPDVADAAGADAATAQADVPQRYAHLFQFGKSINDFDPVGGNQGHLMQDSNATIAAMVADIDAAKNHVHLMFYIWLTDNNGCKMVEALKRAAARGVTCRAMADGLGSRTMIESEHWQAMREAGVCLASARRGVYTTIIFPARNDSWVVGAASRSYYADLLAAGVQIFEYQGGLLHAKSLTLDREVTLIGSANMDRRSFELNYENNILFCDRSLTAEMRQRQDSYIAKSKPVTGEMVARWTWHRRLWNNAIAMLGPVL